MFMKSRVLVVVAALLVTGSAFAGTPSPEGAHVYIISPADGATVNSPVTVRFGLRGMGVAPAGVDKPNTGHHHLLIDVGESPELKGPLPSDARHRHFGGGQTEAVIELSPGSHTLQLIMGDMNHIPHTPPVISERVRITVE